MITTKQFTLELNKMVCAKDGWRHVSIDKWVKVENGEITTTKINNAYLDGKHEQSLSTNKLIQDAEELKAT